MTNELGQRCTDILMGFHVDLTVAEAHRRACNAALPELADTIRDYATRLYWCSRKLDGVPGNIFATLGQTSATDAEFRRDAEEWAAEITSYGQPADADTYITARRTKAQSAWDGLLPVVEATLSDAEAIVGTTVTITWADVTAEATDNDEGDDECEDCGGTGEDLDGEACGCSVG